VLQAVISQSTYNSEKYFMWSNMVFTLNINFLCHTNWWKFVKHFSEDCDYAYNKKVNISNTYWIDEKFWYKSERERRGNLH